MLKKLKSRDLQDIALQITVKRTQLCEINLIPALVLSFFVQPSPMLSYKERGTKGRYMPGIGHFRLRSINHQYPFILNQILITMTHETDAPDDNSSKYWPEMS